MKAHLIRGAVYLLLLLAVCVIPFALGQRTTGERSATAKIAQLSATSSDGGSGALAMPEFPMGCCLWNQYDNPATKPPVNIGSQEFEPPMTAFNDQAADDFVLPPLPPNNFFYLTGVRVMGEYSQGGGPASSFNIYIYGNAPGHLPGGLIAAILNRPYTGTPPDFMINLITPLGLSPGTYWVSVQARQDFNYVHSVANSYTYCHSNRDGHTDVNSDPDSNCDGDTHTYFHVHSDTATETYSNSAASPNTGTPPVAIYEKETHCSIRLV